MASEKILSQKQEYVNTLKGKIEAAQGGVVFNYGGITVEEDTVLRKELREAGVNYEVVKNTLLKLAIKDSSIEGMSNHLAGTTALALSSQEDPIAAARVLYKFCQEHKDASFSIKTGYMDGEVLDIDSVNRLATLPSREGLLSMLLSALTGNLRGLACAIDAVKTQKEEQSA